MIKLDFSIGSIKYSLDCDDDEAETFREIIKVLNTKTNEIMMNTGKIDDKLILFIILLININKEKNIINNFENKVLELLKSASEILNSKETLESQLIIGNIIKQSQTLGLEEKNTEENTEENNKKLQNILLENKKNNDETLLFIDDIIKFIEKLANNIDKL